LAAATTSAGDYFPADTPTSRSTGARPKKLASPSHVRIAAEQDWPQPEAVAKWHIDPPLPNAGLEKAHEAAREVRGVEHFEPHERASDWNDVAAHRGRRTAASEIEAGLAELGVQVPKLG
jgi:hypothetical protein